MNYRVQRSDVTHIDATSRTREGYIDTHGTLTKTGLFEYVREDGTVQRELRLPEHVFAKEHLDSIVGAPLTLRHPSTLLDPSTFRQHTVGFVFEPVTKGDELRARIRVMDRDAIAAVDRGVKALSNGYETTLVPIPNGVFRRDDFNGGAEVRADFLQTELLNNHTALVDRGRAGPTARLDSAGNQGEAGMNEQEKKTFDEALAAKAKAEKDAQEAKARADEAAGKLAVYEAREKTDKDEAAQKAHAALASEIAVLVKKDEKDLAKLDEAALLKMAVETAVKCDGFSIEALRGAYAAIKVSQVKRSDAATLTANAVALVKRGVQEEIKIDQADSSDSAFREQNEKAANFWKQKSA